MTNEDAIKHLQTYSTTIGSGQTTDEQHNEAKKMAIKALTELDNNSTKVDNENVDLISRQAVQEMVDRIGGMYSYRQIGNRESYSKYNEAWTDAINRVDAELNSLPSAQQEQRCDECVFKPFKQFQPERKKGKWIPCDVDSRGMTDMFVCSKCGSFTSLPILKYANAMEYDYCPNCGSYNGGES